MDKSDPQFLGVLNTVDDSLLSIYGNRSLIRPVNTAQYIHKRGFPRPIFTQKPQNLPLIEGSSARSSAFTPGKLFEIPCIFAMTFGILSPLFSKWQQVQILSQKFAPAFC